MTEDPASLIGATSKLSLFDNNGDLIVKEGEIITPGIISAARDAGRLGELRLAAGMAAHEPADILPATEFEEIGEEEPTGVHPE